ncbi:MAG: glycosyltransferase [Anaerolineaceae bacterium]|nr:glycosyltransferase [Anaerolineaceae bacterium]
MKTCLVNLAYLDPSRIGGVGRIAYEVSRLLADYAENSSDLRVIFVVNWRFAGEFWAWLDHSAIIVPFITRHDLRLTLWLLKTEVVVSPLFGIEPFNQSQALHVAGMPDALALDHPELFSAADLTYRQSVYFHLAQAFRVITLSQDARERLLHHTDLQPEQIAVVALGADTQGAAEAVPVPNLPVRYLYYPANVWPHKRHDLLFQIMSHLWEQQPDIQLVMSGGRSDQDRQTLRDLAAKYNCPSERIHDLGYVDDAQLITLYQKAEALLFVSQYEGFGMPVLEAMQHQCPVICAPLAAIPEMVGQAGIYVDNENPQDWVTAIIETLPEKRDQLIAAGIERAKQFTWAKTRAGWADVLASAGISAGDHSSSSNKKIATTAEHIQPLLEQVSRIANLSSGSRWKRLIALPNVLILQLRLLWQARRYRYGD